MKKNMGNIDRGLRAVLAIVMAVIYFTGMVSGTFGIILLVAAIIFLATSFVSFCPAYTLFGINTCPKK